MKELKLVGGYGSPYSRKMRAVLRYRRFPFRWILRGSTEDVGIPPVAVALIPVLVFAAADGAPDEAMIDSTFQIRMLESMSGERSLFVPDAALRFLDSLIEDYADEWVTKAMFHYRWKYAPDIRKASYVLALDRNLHLSGEKLEHTANMFAERQIARLSVVGSNDTTTPIIEQGYRRLLGLLDAHLARGTPFLAGQRPGVGDFGLFGQLSQLVHFDPTPAALAAETAARVVSWVSWMDDLSWRDAPADGWLSRDEARRTLRPFMAEIGRTYVSFLLANARALERGADELRCEIDGHRWVQKPFPYQGKCLKWLREGYSSLAQKDRAFVDELLSGTGADALFLERP